MIKWAGVLITLCGLGHTVGALVQTVPRYASEWLSWALWEESNRNLVEMSHTSAAFWFTVYSFGVPLMLIGLTILWLSHRNITPPPFVAWVLAVWISVGETLAGPSPLLAVLIAAILLLTGSRRARRSETWPARVTRSTGL